MDTYKPLLTNSELKTLCKLAEKSADTPLAQTRKAHQAIDNLRKQHKPKRLTVEERMADKMAKQVAALKESIE